MKTKFLSSFAAVVLALVCVAAGCSTSNSASKAQDTEALLTQSGFRIIPAGTPTQLQQVQSLPAGKVTPVQRHGKTYYVYPDSTRRQLFVGNESQFQAYRNALSAEHRKVLDAAVANAHPLSTSYEAEQLHGSTQTYTQWEHGGWGPWNIAE